MISDVYFISCVDTNQHMSLGPKRMDTGQPRQSWLQETSSSKLFSPTVYTKKGSLGHQNNGGKNTAAAAAHASNTSFLMRFGSAEGAPQEKRAMDYDSAAIRAITQRNDPLKGRFFPVIFFRKTHKLG